MKAGIGTFPLHAHRPLLHKTNPPRQPEEMQLSAINQLGRLISDVPGSFLAWYASISE
jgi:hypothetical protein